MVNPRSANLLSVVRGLGLGLYRILVERVIQIGIDWLINKSQMMADTLSKVYLLSVST